ncbi:MAG TPA: hypothetical protein VN715_12730 [Roseiarcus sp.]|nr:hypothetical protein [Roseiarcus sp.]
MAVDSAPPAALSDFVAGGQAGLAAPRPNAAAASEAPYPHIYQAPLFGALFAVSANQTAVDESALRYYASLHNYARANAEIRRLKALHPSWTPPTNIYASAGAGADEQPFWDLLAADRLEELKAGVALKERTTPGWKPSRDLMTKIARKLAIEELVKDTDEHKPAEALAVADADPSILHCAYMDADWRVADAFLAIGLPKRGFEIYHAIIATCPDHDERLATVRKAISRFSFDQTRSLIAMGAKSADGATEFDAAKLDLTRAEIAASNQGKMSAPIAPQALADFFAAVGRSHAAADLALAGWFEYNRGHFDKAASWFSHASLGSPVAADATTINLAEGRALSLLKLGKVEPALALAYVWRDVSKTMRQTYIGASAELLTRVSPPPAISDQGLADFAAVVEADRSFLGAQATGWYRYNRSEWDNAVTWFGAALMWKGVDANAAPGPGEVAAPTASAIEGYGRALAGAGRLDDATAVADRWRGGGAALEAVFVDLMSAAIDAAPAVSALKADPLAHFAAIAALRRNITAAAGLGWLHYRSADYPGAVGWFRKAVAWGQGRPDLAANQGLALALKQTGALAEAEDVAWTFSRDSADLRAIYVSAVVAELAADKASLPPRRLNRFVDLVRAHRSSAGAQALGWYRLKEGNCVYAAPWFRKAAAWSAASDEDIDTARGLTLSLKAVGALAEAEDLAYAWRERDSTLSALYADIGIEELTSQAPVYPMSEARLRRLSERVLAERLVKGAQALGWRRYGQAACGYGGQWLKLAAAWGDADKRDVKTDEGLGLSLRSVGRLDAAASLAWPWVAQAPLMKTLYVETMAERLARDNPPEPIDEAQLKDFAAVVASLKSPLGAQALGWYRLERRELPEAARWFKTALAWWPAQRANDAPRAGAVAEDYRPLLAKLALTREDYRRTPLAYKRSAARSDDGAAYVDTFAGLAKTEEGYVEALRALGRADEAETIAWGWRERWPALGDQFLSLAVEALNRTDGPEISPERMSRFTAAIEGARSASAATALGWRRLRAHAPDAAEAWFAKALGWSARAPDPGLVEGYVAALQAQQKFAPATKLAERWRGVSPQLNVIYLRSELQALRASGAADAASAAKYAGVEAEIAKARSGDGALSVGWLAYQNKDFAQALSWFRDALAWGGDAAKAKEGVALSLRALERYADLAAFGYAERATPAVREVYYGGMVAWLTADKPVLTVSPAARQSFEDAVVADRSAVGAQALGWGAELRGQWPAARRWFASAVAWSGFDPLAAPQKPDAARLKLVEGYVRALRGAGAADGAEDVAYVWRDAAPALGGLYLEIFTQSLADDGVALSAPRLARFSAFAISHRAAAGAGALGWRFYRAHANGDAIAWFEHALAWAPEGPPPKQVAEGYVLSLRAAGRLEDAESFAYGLAKDPDMRALYIAAVVAELADAKTALAGPRLARFVASVTAAHSALGARALGWRRLSGDNCVYAAPWFRKAAAWSADSADDFDTARGLALALRKVGAYAAAENLAYAWRERSPDMEKLFIETAAAALESQAPQTTISEARLRRLSQRVLADRSVVGARALGWRRYGEAACGYGGDWFRFARAWSGDADAKTDEGYGLSLRATGRLASAAALAYRSAAQAPAMRKLYVDVMVEALSRDNPPEPVDEARLKDFAAAITSLRSALGAQALGWYRLERREPDDAARWFKLALDWWPAERPDPSQRLSAVADGYKPMFAKLALDAKAYRRTPLAYLKASALVGASTQDYVNTAIGLAKTEEGFAETLRMLGRAEEAEAIAWGWRNRWPALNALFLDIAAAELDRKDGPALAPARLQRYLVAIEADRSAGGAAAMAWRQYRLEAFDSAADWFRKALAWSKAGAPPQTLIEGYVLALQGAKKFDAAEAVAAKWRSASPELNLVYIRSELQRLRTTGKAAAVAPSQFAEIEKTMAGAKSADGALSLAWVAYEAHDYAHALQWFRNAETWGAGATKAKEGVALSLRALERYADLAAFGFPERHASPALHDAYFGGMVAWLTSDKPLRAVRPQARADFEQAVAEERSVVGVQALAWGALMRGDATLALKGFEAAIAWSGFDPMAALGAPDAAQAKLVEGYVQALRASGDLGRAEDVGYLWRDASASLGGLYLQIFTQELAADSAALSDARIARFSALAEIRRSPQAAGALGWRAYRGKSFSEAIAWFGKAIDWSPGHDGDAKIDEGLALSLRAAGRLVDAEDFAWAHRAKSRELRAAYVAAFSDQLLDAKLAPTLSALRLARFGQIVMTDKISAGAAALGWRRLRDGNCGYAIGWFRKAIAWSDHKRGGDKLYAGLAQGLRAVGMFSEAEDAAFAYADRSPEARELYINIAVEELTRQWPRVPTSETRIARFAAVVERDHSAKGAQALGWRRYMQAGCGYGGRWFELAAAWSPDKRGDAHLNEGYGLSLRAVGRLARAEVLARPWIERAPAMKKLYIDIAVEELSRDNPPEPIAEDRVAAIEATFASVHSALGAQALGWYRFARGENEPAALWFKNALDWWPQLAGDAGQKLAAPVDDYHALLAHLALLPQDYRRTPRAYPNSALQIGRDAESYVKTELGLAKTVEGYVRALSALSRYDEAETLAFRWLDRWPPLRQVLIDMAATQLSGPADLSADRLARFAALIEQSRSEPGAQALGWRAYKAKDYAGAARWMKAAIDWRPANGKLGLDVARAYADSLSNLKQYDQALAFLAAWRDRIPDLRAVSVSVGLDSLAALAPNSTTATARIAAIAREVSAAHSAAGAQSLGWLANGRKEFAGAEAWFKKAIEWAAAGADPDPKALEGYARALQGEGRLNDALRFTEEWSARQPALAPVYVQAAAQALAAAAGNGEDLATATLARAGRAFAQARSANGAQALAWQRVSQHDWVAAVAWFQAARNWAKSPDADPKATEGLIIALRHLHRDDQAEALAYSGGQHDEALRGLYLEIVADRLTRKPPAAPDENGMRRYAAAVVAAQSVNGAQALGWYSYGVRQYPAAVAWFEKSLAFGPSENAAYGLAMTYRKLGERDNYRQAVQTYRDAYAKVAELGGARRRPRERRAAFEDEAARAPRLRATLSARTLRAASPASAGVGGDITRGWKLLNQGRPSESAQAFETALASATGAQRRDAAYGRSLALMSAGETGEAGRVAASAPLTEKQRNEVGTQLLARRAWDAYNADRYLEALNWLNRRAAFAAESRDLMQMRAWCLQKLGRVEAAETIQSQLDQQLAP